MRKTILKIYMILLFLFATMRNISFSSTNDVNFITTELLGRPTDKSVTVNAIADADLEVFFEYGTESSVYANLTDTTMFPRGTPIEMIIDKLQPNTRYYYRMRYRKPGESQFSAGAEHSFHIQRARGSTFKFAIQADSHLYDKKCYPALYQITLQNVLAFVILCHCSFAWEITKENAMLSWMALPRT